MVVSGIYTTKEILDVELGFVVRVEGGDQVVGATGAGDASLTASPNHLLDGSADEE